MGNKYDVAFEIKYSKMRNDFYRYLAWRIQTADLERKPAKKHKNFDYPLFTDKSWKKIESFVWAAVQIYNKSHRQKTTLEHALGKLKEWWDCDCEEYQIE